MKYAYLLVFSTLSILAPWCASSSTPEQVTYTTNRGFVFTLVDYANFDHAWKAPDGSVWSSCLGNFTNIGVWSPAPSGTDPSSLTDGAGWVTHSAATDACEKIGGHLPMLEDYKVLMTYFYGRASNAGIHDITNQDVKDYLALFPDCASPSGGPGMYWTATCGGGQAVGLPPHPRAVGGFDAFGDPKTPSELFSVRCVGR